MGKLVITDYEKSELHILDYDGASDVKSVELFFNKLKKNCVILTPFSECDWVVLETVTITIHDKNAIN